MKNKTITELFVPKVRISEYEYGRITKKLRSAVKWINGHRATIRNNILNEKISIEFDFDDYWGMPKSISYKLSPDEVDFIQDQVGSCYEKFCNLTFT